MNTPLHHFFTTDHHRLDELLDQATSNSGKLDENAYHQFRTGLLKHIKMEEKILFPAAQRANGGTPLPLASKLRLDHGAITALLVVPPSSEVIQVLRHVLTIHDQLEEEPQGMYEICERLTHFETQAILDQLHATTEVPVNPHNPADYAFEAAKRALLRAGFDYDEIVRSHSIPS